MTTKSIKTLPVKQSDNGKATATTQKPTVDEVKRVLDEQIRNFQKKSELIHNRDKFIKTKEDLEQFIASQGADYDEFMEDSGKKVSFKDKDAYNDRDSISISNNYLVREFAQFMISKIEAKVAEIELEILN